MESRPAACLGELRAAIAARWIELLRAAPAAHPAARALVVPAMLEFLVEDTLTALTARLEDGTAEGVPPGELLPAGLVREKCRCGLHLLLTYYLSGAQALRERLPKNPAAVRAKIIHAFTLQAREAWAGLCGLCPHRGGPLCGWKSTTRTGRLPAPAPSSPP